MSLYDIGRSTLRGAGLNLADFGDVIYVAPDDDTEDGTLVAVRENAGNFEVTVNDGEVAVVALAELVSYVREALDE